MKGKAKTHPLRALMICVSQGQSDDLREWRSLIRRLLDISILLLNRDDRLVEDPRTRRHLDVLKQ